MKFKDFLNEGETKKTKEKIFNYISDNPDITYEEFKDHISDADAIVFEMAKGFITGYTLKHGSDPDSDYDPVQLKKGIEVEHEHHDSDLIAKAIAKAHIAEYKDYYTRLAKMEKEAEKYWKMK